MGLLGTKKSYTNCTKRGKMGIFTPKTPKSLRWLADFENYNFFTFMAVFFTST